MPGPMSRALTTGGLRGSVPPRFLMDLLAERVVDPCDPVVGEYALLFVQDAVGDALGKGRSVDVQRVFLADRLIPAAEEEAGVVDVVVEVVVREE